MATGRSKAGSSTARAARARQGHAKRRGKLWAVSGKTGRAHYKGSSDRRTRTSWLW
jgi:hypothetical protein